MKVKLPFPLLDTPAALASCNGWTEEVYRDLLALQEGSISHDTWMPSTWPPGHPDPRPHGLHRAGHESPPAHCATAHPGCAESLHSGAA